MVNTNTNEQIQMTAEKVVTTYLGNKAIADVALANFWEALIIASVAYVEALHGKFLLRHSALLYGWCTASVTCFRL